MPLSLRVPCKPLTYQPHSACKRSLDTPWRYPLSAGGCGGRCDSGRYAVLPPVLCMLGCMHVHDVICMTSSLAIAHCSRVCSALHSSSTANSTAGLGSVSATSEAGTGDHLLMRSMLKCSMNLSIISSWPYCSLVACTSEAFPLLGTGHSRSTGCATSLASSVLLLGCAASDAAMPGHRPACAAACGCSFAALTSANFASPPRFYRLLLLVSTCHSGPQAAQMSMCGPSHSHIAPACRPPTHSKHHAGPDGEHCAVDAEHLHSQA